MSEEKKQKDQEKESTEVPVNKTTKKGRKTAIEISTEMSNSILKQIKSDILSIKDLETIIISGEHDIFLYQEF